MLSAHTVCVHSIHIYIYTPNIKLNNPSSSFLIHNHTYLQYLMSFHLYKFRDRVIIVLSERVFHTLTLIEFVLVVVLICSLFHNLQVLVQVVPWANWKKTSLSIFSYSLIILNILIKSPHILLSNVFHLYLSHHTSYGRLLISGTSLVILLWIFSVSSISLKYGNRHCTVYCRCSLTR